MANKNNNSSFKIIDRILNILQPEPDLKFAEFKNLINELRKLIDLQKKETFESYEIAGSLLPSSIEDIIETNLRQLFASNQKYLFKDVLLFPIDEFIELIIGLERARFIRANINETSYIEELNYQLNKNSSNLIIIENFINS